MNQFQYDIYRIKCWAIRTFGLKGSWSWAKRQMKKGHILKSNGWPPHTCLKLNKFGQFVYCKENGEYMNECRHTISTEWYTDYFVIARYVTVIKMKMKNDERIFRRTRVS